MASNRKYAALPDLDSAPDIYETPELADDNSTIPPTTLRSPADNEFDGQDEAAPISHSRLQIEEARSRFMSFSVDARDVDFSDRVNGKRKSYKVSSRQQRIRDDGTEELGDISDEDEAINLARKIARLKREIEEAKEEYGKQQPAAAQGTSETRSESEDLISLTQALEEVSKLATDELVAWALQDAGKQTSLSTSGVPDPSADSAVYTITYAPNYEQTHALAKAADFDHRLVLLEKALGVGSSAMPELDSGGLPRAVLPTLEALQHQILTLSDASPASLDTITRRVRELRQEADFLEKSRRNAKAAQDALAATGIPPSSAVASDPELSEQTIKVNALYETISTIEKLTPLLPPLLDRLRSLREIHIEAASAREILERIEQRQVEMVADIQQWREGLHKVETAVAGSETTMISNTKIIESWVKDLEARMAKTG